MKILRTDPMESNNLAVDKNYVEIKEHLLKRYDNYLNTLQNDSDGMIVD